MGCWYAHFCKSIPLNAEMADILTERDCKAGAVRLRLGQIHVPRRSFQKKSSCQMSHLAVAEFTFFSQGKIWNMGEQESLKHQRKTADPTNILVKDSETMFWTKLADSKSTRIQSLKQASEPSRRPCEALLFQGPLFSIVATFFCWDSNNHPTNHPKMINKIV